MAYIKSKKVYDVDLALTEIASKTNEIAIVKGDLLVEDSLLTQELLSVSGNNFPSIIGVTKPNRLVKFLGEDGAMYETFISDTDDSISQNTTDQTISSITINPSSNILTIGEADNASKYVEIDLLPTKVTVMSNRDLIGLYKCPESDIKTGDRYYTVNSIYYKEITNPPALTHYDFFIYEELLLTK